jgi:hypothetical protein
MRGLPAPESLQPRISPAPLLGRALLSGSSPAVMAWLVIERLVSV